MTPLSYCSNLVREADYDRWLCALFVPSGLREPLWVLLAFHAEIARIPHITSEPMLGQMRLTWWREALNELGAGKPPRRHPVLQALQQHMSGQTTLEDILTAYTRQIEEGIPVNAETLLLPAIHEICGEEITRWQKKWAVLEKHPQQRNKPSVRKVLRLLFA